MWQNSSWTSRVAERLLSGGRSVRLLYGGWQARMVPFFLLTVDHPAAVESGFAAMASTLITRHYIFQLLGVLL